MTKIQYYQLKNYLKVVATEIKIYKPPLKISYKQRSQAEKMCKEEMKSVKNFLLNQTGKQIRFYQKEVLDNKRLFRYLHIVYCIARGRTYRQIENKVRKGNEINFNEIKFYFNKAGVEIPENFRFEIESVALVA